MRKTYDLKVLGVTTMCESISIQNQLGNVLHIKFVYPQVNPDDYIRNISDALFYTGLLDGMAKSATSASQNADDG